MADIYDTHLKKYRKIAHIRTMEEYRRHYERSIEAPEAFWAEQAERYLSWDKPWDSVLRYDFDEAEIEWFGRGVLNAAYNCLDRHIGTRKDKVAYHWEGDKPGEARSITYSQLYEQVNRLAAVLRAKGVAKGDRVIIYMPMIAELPAAMLACARIGAIHSVVFAGFSAKALVNRISDCGARMVITADGSCRAGKTIPLKKNVDDALRKCPDVKNIIVFSHIGLKLDLDREREFWWHEAIADPDIPSFVPPEPMDAEDPLFILYTSGSTIRPKGLVHTHGGYLLYAAMTTHLVFDLKDEDVFWCTANIGWIAGHSYGVYGPLLNGLTSVLFEGTPFYPDYDRYWEIVAKYQVSKFYTSPTVIRMLARKGDAHLKKHDISCLRILGAGGEAMDSETWQWYHHHVGGDRCPIMDTYWQAETGGHMITPLPGTAPLKPGSCSFPFLGIDPVILDDTGEEAIYPNQEGVLCIRKPWPGMARTIYGEHERFIDNYFYRIPGMYFTADGAFRDDDGYYRITGRIDDTITVSGHSFNTAEIELAIMLHTSVTEAAVVGCPHPIKGQGTYAFVTLRSDVAKSDALKQEMIHTVRDEIGPIITIDVIQWADALPKTRSGKIIRHILEKIAAGKAEGLEDISAMVDPTVVERLVKACVSLR